MIRRRRDRIVIAGIIMTALWGALIAAMLLEWDWLQIDSARIKTQHQTIVHQETIIKDDQARIAALQRHDQTDDQDIERLRKELIQIAEQPCQEPASVQAGPWARFEVTAYSTHEAGQGHTTYTGAPVQDNWTIAVDPSVIPLNSLVEIKFSDGSSRIYKAEDIGGAIRGYHIDIFKSNASLRDGVHEVEARILVRG